MIPTVFSLISSMNGIQRFSGLKPCHPENVLEHTGMVCVFCYIITSYLNQIEQTLNLGEVMRRAVVHDWDETISGDVSRPTKYFSPELRRAMTKLEKAGIENIAKKLDLKDLISDHLNSKNKQEGAVVAFADTMAAIHKVWEEVMVYNNSHFIQPARNMRRVLEEKIQHIKVEKFFTPDQEEVLIVMYEELEAILAAVLNRANILVELHNED